MENGKAADPVRIDLHGKASFADFLVIVSGTSSRHVTSLADNLVKAAKENGYTARVEGKNGSGNWVVVDLGSVIVHIFHAENRKYYNLEDMWLHH